MKPCKSQAMSTFFLWTSSVSHMSPFAAEAPFHLCHFLKYYKHMNCLLQNQSEITKKGFFLNNDLFVFLRSLHFSFRQLKLRANGNRIDKSQIAHGNVPLYSDESFVSLNCLIPKCIVWLISIRINKTYLNKLSSTE